jgi:6-phosphogluconolactonase
MTTTLVLVGSYAKADQPGLHAFWFDVNNGSLRPHGTFTGILNPSFFIIHPNKRWLYTVSETGQAADGVPGSVWAVQFEREPWRMTPLTQQASRGDWPCHLQLDASGGWIFVSNYGHGNVGVLPLQSNGGLGAMTDLAQHHGHGPHAHRQEAAHAHSATVTPDGRFVIVADLGTDELVVYRFDAATGKLGAHAHANARPGAGPRHMAFHPNGRLVYVANELDCTVSAYDYDPSSGALRERQWLATLPPGAPETIVADLHLNTRADRLYVSNRGHNSIAVFEVDEAGALTRLAVPSCGGDWPRNFAVAPDDRFILVANQYSGEVCVLPVTADGLGERLARASVPGASCIQFL